MIKRTLLCVALASLAPAFALAQSAYTVNESTDELYSVDLSNGALTRIGALGANYEFGDLAYDSARNTMYMVDGWGPGFQAISNLWRVDLNTGAASLIGATGVNDLFGLTYDPRTDKLFASKSTTSTGVFELDRNTGLATGIGDPAISLDGLTYNSNTGDIVGTFAGPGSFWSIDRVTGAPTLLSNGDGFVNNNGVAYEAGSNSYYTIDWSGDLYRYDGNSYTRTLVAGGLGAHDGLAIVPEPGTMIALGAGLAALAARRRRK
jgi:hypothetical protein